MDTLKCYILQLAGHPFYKEIKSLCIFLQHCEMYNNQDNIKCELVGYMYELLMNSEYEKLLTTHTSILSVTVRKAIEFRNIDSISWRMHCFLNKYSPESLWSWKNYQVPCVQRNLQMYYDDKSKKG